MLRHMNSKKRILSGVQPTGKLHIGNYVGALANWVELQHQYESFHCVVDWHSLTVTYDQTERIADDTLEVFIDLLAIGLDPSKATIFLQSMVPEHAELHLLLSMLITLGRLERNPTFKERVKDLDLRGEVSYGHLGYPVLQAADILIYRAHAVPVGEDQAPHLELTRELARKFNTTYAEIFPEPNTLLTPFPRVPGPDGRKMSKSLGNHILMSDEPDVVLKKVMSAITDPEKIRKDDPGNPDICNVYAWHIIFSSDQVESISATCRSGERGCVMCKQEAAAAIADHFGAFREERKRLEEDPDTVRDVIITGTNRASEVAQETMELVRDSMGLLRPGA
ncbi:tryptophan--tRNA ligase [Candidatus Zixiibacteriota bacterium]